MAGEYRLLRKLGEGGFGAVYEAEHPLLKRRAAVKVLHRIADRDSDAVQRFISEAQAVNQIRNRYIIDVFSFGKLEDGRHFYVMDLLDGAPLDRWLKQQGPVDVATAIQLLTPIADALDRAHAAGIVHRDLKPQNIFLAWDTSGEVTPKLLDFGMAKLLGESSVHTVSGTPIGTPLYMSPEQARGDKIDHRSDVYALGVVCHEMLTGHLPFVGDTTVAVLMAHIIQQPPRASDVNPQLSPLLDAPILRMLEKDPNLRPGAAGEAILGLRRAAEEAGIALDEGPLRLPRPEPLPAAAASGGEPDTLLDAPTTERDAPPTTSSAGPSRFPLWPFGLGLLALGVTLGFVVLHDPPPSAGPEAPPELTSEQSAALAAPPAPSRLPSKVEEAERLEPPEESEPASAASAFPVGAATPSASGSAASPEPTSASRKNDKSSRPAAPSPARIPTDLENPF